MRWDYPCFYEFGLVMCALGRGGRPPSAKLGCSVSLLADMLTFTAPPLSLCCSHHRDSGLTDRQKSQHSINLLSQLAVNGGIRCTQGVNAHARTHFQSNAVVCRGRSENIHTQTLCWSEQEIQSPNWLVR